LSAMLDVSNALKFPGQVYRFDAELELPEMEVLNDPVRFEDIAVHGEYFAAGDKISVRCQADAVVHTRCSRCLEPVQMSISAEVDACFARMPDPEDPDLYTYESSVVNLTDAVSDALLLELPYRFLCSENCKGLCSSCGINLNLGTCTCQEGLNVTNPFSALKAIVQNNEEV